MDQNPSNTLIQVIAKKEVNKKHPHENQKYISQAILLLLEFFWISS